MKYVARQREGNVFMQPTAQQIEQQIEQKITNAQTLKDLLECLETIERKIWRNRHFKKPYYL